METNDLTEAVLALPENERFILMETLLSSLTKDDSSILEAHLKEAKLRLANYKSGNSKTYSLDEIIDAIG